LDENYVWAGTLNIDVADWNEVTFDIRELIAIFIAEDMK